MKDYIEIKKIKQTGPFTLLLLFNDNSKKEIDFLPYIVERKGGVFDPLIRKSEFKKFRIDMAGGLCWACGADFAPDTLYEFNPNT